MIESGGMVGEMVGGNIAVLWAMADERAGRLGTSRSKSTAAERNVRPTHVPTTRASTGERRVEMGEAAFLAKVSSLGFTVAKTWGDSDRYDFVVDGGAGLWRVQVKSAHRAGEDGEYNFHAHGHTMVPYGVDEIDALVAYCVPEDAWYVFPVSFFSVRRSMNLFPASRRKRSRFEKYREAWWILRGAVGGERLRLKIKGDESGRLPLPLKVKIPTLAAQNAARVGHPVSLLSYDFVFIETYGSPVP